MNNDHYIGSKFYDLLDHQVNEDKKRYSIFRYDAKLKVYVTYHAFYHRGCNLNETNIKNFNTFMEKEIKDRYRFLMDFYIEMLPNFEANLPEVRKKLGIDIEDWQDDSIKKDYYRYRIRNNKPLLYKNNSNGIITPTSHLDPAF